MIIHCACNRHITTFLTPIVQIRINGRVCISDRIIDGITCKVATH